MPVLEIRGYNLKPGTTAEFHRLVEEESVPLLHRFGVDVVAHGVSLHEEHAYYLMRAYASVEELERSEAAFYGSTEWRNGPRQAVLDCIDTFATMVIEVDVATIDGLRPD